MALLTRPTQCDSPLFLKQYPLFHENNNKKVSIAIRPNIIYPLIFMFFTVKCGLEKNRQIRINISHLIYTHEKKFATPRFGNYQASLSFLLFFLSN